MPVLPAPHGIQGYVEANDLWVALTRTSEDPRLRGAPPHDTGAHADMVNALRSFIVAFGTLHRVRGQASRERAARSLRAKARALSTVGLVLADAEAQRHPQGIADPMAAFTALGNPQALPDAGAGYADQMMRDYMRSYAQAVAAEHAEIMVLFHDYVVPMARRSASDLHTHLASLCTAVGEIAITVPTPTMPEGLALFSTASGCVVIGDALLVRSLN